MSTPGSGSEAVPDVQRLADQEAVERAPDQPASAMNGWCRRSWCHHRASGSRVLSCSAPTPSRRVLTPILGMLCGRMLFEQAQCIAQDDTLVLVAQGVDCFRRRHPLDEVVLGIMKRRVA